MLFKYCTGRCRQRVRSVPSFLLPGIAELYIGARSVLITRGWGWDRSPSALRNSRLAASASRNADSRKSMVVPFVIDGPIQVAPATLHANVGFVHSPRLVCRLEMPSQSLLHLRAVILHPAPDRGVIDIETALLQQLLNIAQRQRIAKIPPDRTKYEAGFGLPPFEDRGSGSHFAILSRHQPATPKVATHPPCRIEGRAGITELCVARNDWVVCSSTMSGKRHEPSVGETPLPWKRRRVF